MLTLLITLLIRLTTNVHIIEWNAHGGPEKIRFAIIAITLSSANQLLNCHFFRTYTL